ncbi:MAG: N-acetylmuramic acid 6-phosphate etherase, partial [Planctomycetota bacterium]
SALVELKRSMLATGFAYNIQEGERQAQLNVTSQDIVIGIAASGTTPFVLSFLETSAQKKAKTVLLTFNRITPPAYVQYCIAPQVGPEVIAGSTRLKAGTATKMILNWISSISMICVGKVYSHFMVDVHPSCDKLRNRTVRIFINLTGLSATESEKWLKNAEGRIKPAMVMYQKKCSLEQAKSLLQKHQDHLRQALNDIEVS